MEEHLSECCGEKLKYYDRVWKDGVCTKCDHHSPEKELETV